MSASHVFLAAGLAAASLAASAPHAPGGQARLGIERGQTYTVQALFDGASAQPLTYRLDVVREGAAGRSTTAQSGAFAAAAGQTDTLSTVRVSAASGDRVRIRLVVSSGSVTVSETALDEIVR